MIKLIQTQTILGIDPGTNITGYGVVEIRDQEIKLISSGIFDLRSLVNHQEKLKEIFLQLQDIVETYLPRQMAIEAPFFGKNVQSMLKLGRAQGVAMAAAMTMGLDIFEYSPKKIKLAMTGNGNASKEQVAFMVQQRLKQQIDDKYMDATDAIAVALCHIQNASSPISKTKKHGSWESYVKENQAKISKIGGQKK